MDNEDQFLQLSLSIGPRSPTTHPTPITSTMDDEDQFLQLSLTMGQRSPTIHPTPRPITILPPQAQEPEPEQKEPEQEELELEPEAQQVEPKLFMTTVPSGNRKHARKRKQAKQKLGIGKSNTIPAPYPWALNSRAMIHNLTYLLDNGMTIISGLVQCKQCDKQYEIEYELKLRFMEIARFIVKNKSEIRAPSKWKNASFPNCRYCNHAKCVEPVKTEKKTINWLFLFLGENLGCLRLKDLKYFCKHTMNHRTGAKDRVLYYAYLGLCKQLDPSGPFHP